MTTVEREAQREDLRERIIEAARDIVSEEGLDALSMRALGVRIGYSPATIYLHFQDKEELLGSVLAEGFKRLGAAMADELVKAEAEPSSLDHLAATARGYARFALENTGYFRAMFEMPGVARMQGCPAPCAPGVVSQETAATVLRRAQASGELCGADPDRATLLGWGMMHGLTSLYVSGHLAGQVESEEEFMDLTEGAIEVLRAGFKAG